MSDHPELPYLAASGVAVVGATVRDGHLPDLTRVVLGTVAIVIVVSMTGGTKLAPLTRAFGLLILLVAVLSATHAVIGSHKRKAKS